MCGKILRIKQLGNFSKLQRHAWRSIQRRRKWISWRIIHCLLTFFRKCQNLARIGGPDILWSVNKLARVITKWTKAGDKRFARLISYIHHTTDHRQHCHVGNTVQHCRLGLFQDSDFARDIEDSKSTSGGILCIFGSHTFVPISWMCKKQTSVSHSSAEAAVPALDLWDLVIEVFHSSPNQTNKTKDVREPQRNKCQPRTPIWI